MKKLKMIATAHTTKINMHVHMQKFQQGLKMSIIEPTFK